MPVPPPTPLALQLILTHIFNPHLSEASFRYKTSRPGSHTRRLGGVGAALRWVLHRKRG